MAATGDFLANKIQSGITRVFKQDFQPVLSSCSIPRSSAGCGTSDHVDSTDVGIFHVFEGHVLYTSTYVVISELLTSTLTHTRPPPNLAVRTLSVERRALAVSVMKTVLPMPKSAAAASEGSDVAPSASGCISMI
jgi:hypothetical protein